VEIVEPRDFVADGMFREVDFRNAIKKFDWSKYKDKPVLIQGVPVRRRFPPGLSWSSPPSSPPSPKSISYGELSRPIPVSGKLGEPIES